MRRCDVVASVEIEDRLHRLIPVAHFLQEMLNFRISSKRRLLLSQSASPLLPVYVQEE